MVLFGLVSAVAGFVKVRFLVDKAIIDNVIFRMHYRLTAGALFLCCILCTANSLIGDPIKCIHHGGDKLEHAINAYCWITTTFTAPHLYRSSIPGKHVAHPGVRPVIDQDEERYHSYYQWVPFVLFLQGVLFYVPHWIWKNWEEGKVKMISEGMRGAMTETAMERKDRISRLVRYIVESMSLHSFYAMGYFTAEILNFINVILNIYFTDKFLGGTFFQLGLSTLNLPMQSEENRFDPLYQIFPRVTKCTFRRYGPSGTIMTEDALCVLALNIINEKIYIFLWFWFIILAVLSGMALLYSILLIFLPRFRKEILVRRFKYRVPHGVSTLIQRTKIGDFLLLHLLGQNINMAVFSEVLEELSQSLEPYSKHNPSAPGNVEMTPIYPSKEFYPLH